MIISQKKIFNGQQLTVRTLQKNDIDQLIHYWYHSPYDYLYKLGIDQHLLPSKEERKNFFLKLVDATEKERESIVIVGEIKGQVIGYALFNHFQELQKKRSCQAHIHIIRPEYRSKGVMTQVTLHILSQLRGPLKVDYLVLTPNSDNQAVNRLLQNMGLKVKRSYIKAQSAPCRQRQVSEYHLSINYTYLFQAILHFNQIKKSFFSLVPKVNKAFKLPTIK